METENEMVATVPEKPKELPQQLPEVPLPAIELPDITPEVKTKEITDSGPNDYTESLNGLVAKYARPSVEKNRANNIF